MYTTNGIFGTMHASYSTNNKIQGWGKRKRPFWKERTIRMQGKGGEWNVSLNRMKV